MMMSSSISEDAKLEEMSINVGILPVVIPFNLKLKNDYYTIWLHYFHFVNLANFEVKGHDNRKHSNIY